MKKKKIYKYATGVVIPEGAVYLRTVTQISIRVDGVYVECWLVWHYFLVEVEKENE